jgi:hypothetical protein
MSATITLYRPVGPLELELIARSGFRRFPPRLPGQPIFYPVVQEAYARKIARDWNVRDSGAGFVTRFQVSADFLARYPEQLAGGREHTEHWIPAEELEAFNDHLVADPRLASRATSPAPWSSRRPCGSRSRPLR